MRLNRWKSLMITQKELESIEVLTVWEKKYTQSDIDDLIKAFQHDIGTSLKLNVKVVDSIPRTHGGKFKFLISMVER